MGARTDATSQQTFDAQFECAACGFAGDAEVTAQGYGSARGWTDAAREDASQQAYHDAVGVAQRTLWFVPCPKCGEVNPGAGRYKAVTVLGTLGLGGATGLLAGLFFGRGDLVVQLSVGGFTAAAFGSIFLWKRARAWWRATERVRF